jgi:ABC-type amino acid transport substrate-binding protein
VSRHESDICGLWEPLNVEKLAWGVRKDDNELRERLNSVLEKWFRNGTVEEVINRWLPYRLEQ